MRKFSVHRNRIRISIALFFAVTVLCGLVAYAASPDAATVLLLHADAQNGAIATVDSSSYGHTIAPSGGAQISTTQSKFGGSSMALNGSDSLFYSLDSTDYEMGSGNFTIDLWAYPTSNSGVAGVFGKCEISPGYCSYLIYRNGSSYLFYSTTASGAWNICNATPAGTSTLNTWSHLAVVRNGSTFTTYQDGVQVSTCTSASTLWDSTDAVRVGWHAGGIFTGYVDEVRLSKGVARWTANFTPESQQYGGGLTINQNIRFNGNLSITGALAKSSGTFVIDHPLDPANKLLYHSFVESPDAKNIYDGIATLDEKGEATIELPSYFMALNKDYRYQYLPIQEAMPNLYIKEEIADNHFTIAGGAPGGRVSWQVTGNRHDPYILAHPIVPEVMKGAEGEPVGVGQYLFEGYNVP